MTIEFDISKEITIKPQPQKRSTLSLADQIERRKKNKAVRNARKKARGIISKPSTEQKIDPTRYTPVAWSIARTGATGIIHNGQLLNNDGTALRMGQLCLGEKMMIYYRDTKKPI